MPEEKMAEEQPKDASSINETEDLKSEVSELRQMIEEFKGSFVSDETQEEVLEDIEEPEQKSTSERTDWKSKYEQAQRKLEAQDTAKMVFEKYPHANREQVEKLVAKGARADTIEQIAEFSHADYIRGQKTIIDKLDEKEKELAKKYADSWGQPDSGDLLTSEAVLTPEKLSKLSKAERKKAAETMPFRGNAVTEEIEWK